MRWPSRCSRAMPPTSAGRSSNTLARSNPTLTSPTGAPPAGGKTGTFARADSPRVPVSHVTTSCPDSASSKLVLTTSPRRSGFGCARRMPLSSVMTTNRPSVRAVTSAA